MFDSDESSKLRLRQWQHVLELETYIIDAGAFHMVLWASVICGGQFWKKGGYTLGETMRGESHMGGKTILEGRG